MSAYVYMYICKYVDICICIYAKIVGSFGRFGLVYIVLLRNRCPCVYLQHVIVDAMMYNIALYENV